MNEKEIDRRKNLTEEAIQKTVIQTLKCLNGEKDEIAERTVKKVLNDMNFHNCPLVFENDLDKEKFQKAIPSLINLDEGIKTAKKRTKWIGLLFLTYLLQNLFDDIVAFFKALAEIVKNIK